MTINTFTRGKKIYLDMRENKKRTRLATGLKNSPLALKFVKANYELFLSDKKKAQAKFYELEDEIFGKKLMKEEKDKTSLPLKDKHFYEIKNEILSSFHLKRNSKKKFQVLLNSIELFLKSKKLDIQSFKKNDIASFYDFFKEKNNNKTIKNKLAMFAKVLTIAQERGLINENPLQKLPKFCIDEKELQKKINTYLSYEQMNFVVKNATGVLQDYLFIAFFTGARTGEILALQKKDILFEKNLINIIKTKHDDNTLGTPKTKNSYRQIDILPILKKRLLLMCEGLKDDDFLIRKKVSKLRAEFKELLKRLDLPAMRLYDTRHTFASIMLSKGEEAMWVGCKMLGHNDLNETFKTYAKYIPQDVKTRARFIDEKDFL
ncbi:site-specific integrase [uncultured Campylobacter sp.]|uniref:site-specific integrase n=1 Tax=uncultured Campylobacter sp. TaxID=218934 RepID=UPI00260E86F1|nr:site-specific integrase [uncultured Campylobacter sp.]